ncbi:hypothetical protein ACX93W_16085 [Paenibacillus sp. CAU 1782]
MAKNKNNKAPQNKQLNAEFAEELVQNNPNSANRQSSLQRQNNRNNQNQK